MIWAIRTRTYTPTIMPIAHTIESKAKRGTTRGIIVTAKAHTAALKGATAWMVRVVAGQLGDPIDR